MLFVLLSIRKNAFIRISSLSYTTKLFSDFCNIQVFIHKVKTQDWCPFKLGTQPVFNEIVFSYSETSIEELRYMGETSKYHTV